jgi:hypothetical protein
MPDDDTHTGWSPEYLAAETARINRNDQRRREEPRPGWSIWWGDSIGRTRNSDGSWTETPRPAGLEGETR